MEMSLERILFLIDLKEGQLEELRATLNKMLGTLADQYPDVPEWLED